MAAMTTENGENEGPVIEGEVIAPEAPETEAEPKTVREAMSRALDAQRNPDAPPKDDKPAAKTGDPAKPRDPQGKFTPADPAKPAVAANAAPQAPEGQQAPAISVHAAPTSWPADAKAAFAQLPPTVQAAVAKREAEVENGFRILQNYKGLEQYSEHLNQAGITHAELTRRALEWEKATLNDPIGAIRHMAQIRGIDPRLVAQALLNPNMPTPRVAAPQQPQQKPINIQAEVDRVLTERETSREIDKFFSDPANIHAEAVAPYMISLIQGGLAKDLQTAYQMAIHANPTTRELVLRQQAAANSAPNGVRAAAATNQARQAARAVTGAPARGQSPSGPSSDPKTIREAVRAAFAEHSGAA